MGRLTAAEAEKRITSYCDSMDKIMKKVKSNLEDMDLENNNLLVKMEEYIQEMETKCSSMKQSLEDMEFE